MVILEMEEIDIESSWSTVHIRRRQGLSKGMGRPLGSIGGSLIFYSAWLAGAMAKATLTGNRDYGPSIREQRDSKLND